jgi:hypothetical protein
MTDVSVPRVVGFGLLSGALFGALAGLFFGDVWVGVAAGLGYGICMSFAMRHVWGSTALKGLSFQQRRQVMRTLRRGEPMHDPQLATALVDQGKATLRQPFNPKVARIASVVAFVLGAVAAVLSIADEGWSGWTSGVPLMVIALVMLFVLLPWNIRTRQRVAHSVEETAKIPASRVARGD